MNEFIAAALTLGVFALVGAPILWLGYSSKKLTDEILVDIERRKAELAAKSAA